MYTNAVQFNSPVNECQRCVKQVFRLRFNQIAIVRTAAVTTLPSYRSPMHQLLVLRVQLSLIVDASAEREGHRRNVYSPQH